MSLFGVNPTNVADAAYGLTVPSSAVAGIVKLIEKAEGILLDEIPSLHQRSTSGRTKPESVKSVIEDMVVRVLRNPNSLRQITVDDGTATIDHAISSGQLYASPAELARLRKDVNGSARGGVRSIRLAKPRM